MNIYQASSASMGTEKGKRILSFILQNFVIFQVMEFGIEAFDFTAYPVKPDVGDADNSARAINADLKKFVYAPGKESGTQRAYGFEFEIDEVYKNDVEQGNITPEGLRRRIENEQIRLAKKVGGDLLTDIIGGDGVSPRILGFKNMIKDVADASGQVAFLGLTQEQIHASLVQVGVQLLLSDEATLRAYEETLSREIADMGGDPVMIMNNYMFARMTAIAKKLNLYGQVETAFGKSIDTFGNTKMVPVPLKYLPQTESDGTNNDCSSIFLVNYNEVDGVRVATNSGFKFTDFAELETKPSGKSRLTFTGNHKIEDMKKMKRLSRIRL